MHKKHVIILPHKICVSTYQNQTLTQLVIVIKWADNQLSVYYVAVLHQFGQGRCEPVDHRSPLLSIFIDGK